jgi:hypothetical protein
VAVGEVRLIAAHAWDVAGAARAGCATAFVARPGEVLDPLVERPEIVGADLAEVADAILAVERQGDRRPWPQPPEGRDRSSRTCLRFCRSREMERRTATPSSGAASA